MDRRLLALMLVGGAFLNINSMTKSQDIFEAAANGDVESIQAFKILGQDINQKNTSWDSFGETPLHFAVMNGQVEAVKYLITRGANVNAQENSGTTSLHHAVSIYPHGSKKELVDNMNVIVGLLLDNGADLTLADNQGNLPLHKAVSSHNIAAIKTLIAKGANTDIKNKAGETPLSLAQKTNKPELINTLKPGLAIQESKVAPQQKRAQRKQVRQMRRQHRQQQEQSSVPLSTW